MDKNEFVAWTYQAFGLEWEEAKEAGEISDLLKEASDFPDLLSDLPLEFIGIQSRTTTYYNQTGQYAPYWMVILCSILEYVGSRKHDELDIIRKWAERHDHVCQEEDCEHDMLQQFEEYQIKMSQAEDNLRDVIEDLFSGKNDEEDNSTPWRWN